MSIEQKRAAEYFTFEKKFVFKKLEALKCSIAFTIRLRSSGNRKLFFLLTNCLL